MSTLLVLPLLVAGCAAPRTTGANARASYHPHVDAPGPTPGLAPPSLSLEPTTDPERAVVALTNAAERCPFDAATGFTDECDAVEAWETESELFADGAADEALVWLIERGSDRARTLAARKLADDGVLYPVDRDLAGRLVSAAVREKSEAVGAPLGRAIAALHFEDTATGPACASLVKTSTNRALVGTLASELRAVDPSDPTPARILESAAHDARPEVRLGAALGLASRSAEEACPAYASLLRDADRRVAMEAARGWTDRMCPAPGSASAADVVLDLFEAWSVAQVSDEVPTVLVGVCLRDDASSASNARAASLARSLTDPSRPVSVREEALRAVLACDPKGGPKYVQRFTHEDDRWVRVRAKDLLKEHGKRHRKP